MAFMGGDRHQLVRLGQRSLKVPPVLCGTAALGNVFRVITDQAKAEIIGEWFRQVPSPVFIEVAYEHGDGMAIEVLGRTLRRLDVAADEVVIQLAANGPVEECWERCCRLLGEAYRPKLISVLGGDEGAWLAASDLKAAGKVHGVGVVAETAQVATSADARQRLLAREFDWFTVVGGCTIMRHPPESTSLLFEIVQRQIPVIATSIFEAGFLVGGSKLDGHAVRFEDESDRSLIAWRKSFVALCDGHGITPAHACIQFALSLPGVAAVRLESTYRDRVSDNIRAAVTKVPENFWLSMKEEGLLEADYPFVG